MSLQYPYFNAPEFKRAQSNLKSLIKEVSKETGQELGFTWRASRNAPSAFEALCREFKVARLTGMAFRVSNENSLDTIYPDPLTNYRFRFWHDTRHAWLNANFSLEGEQAVTAVHLARVKRAGFGKNTMEYRLIEADILGQAIYSNLYNSFPVNQLRFDLRCLELGIEEAVDVEYTVEQMERR